MLEFLALGLGLGLAAGVTPGPLMALLVAHTMRHGTLEGLKIAVAPLVTDIPIVALAVVAVAFLEGSRQLIGGISLAGAAFVAYLGFDAILSHAPDVEAPMPAANSWLRGAAVNALNPHPYLFWFLVGAPILVRAWTAGPTEAAAFLGGFYACLVGAKVVVAVLVGRSARFLRGRAYRIVLVALGCLLLVFAFVLTVEGLDLLRGAAAVS